jgi:hypothetical protein
MSENLCMMAQKVADHYGVDFSTAVRNSVTWKYEELVKNGIIEPNHKKILSDKEIDDSDLAIKIGGKVYRLVYPSE